MFKPFEHEAPHVVIEPRAQRAGQMLQVNARDHPFRQQANGGEIDAADEGEPAQNAIDVLGGIAARDGCRERNRHTCACCRRVQWG